MLFFYRILTFFLFPFFVAVTFSRRFYNKEDKIRFKEKLTIDESFFPKDKKVIWIHAASVGEINSVFPLVDKLIKNDESLFILLTSTTLSSSQLIKKKNFDKRNFKHHFFTLDVQFLVNKFLNHWRPTLVIFVESEVWPNYLMEINKRKIPLMLLNGRISVKTFKRWKFLNNFSKKLFSLYNLCLASSKESENNLKNLGAKNVKFIGNLKFCSKVSIEKKYSELKTIFPNYFIWCAASTHPDEEEIILKSHFLIKQKGCKIITIIIPRHINRSKDIREISKKFKIQCQIINKFEDISERSEILIINSIGELINYFHNCKSVFMGKSLAKKLIKVSGQNPIEPAKCGCKIYHGPYISNFYEIYSFLKDKKIAYEIKDENELAENLIKDFDSVNNINKKNIDELNDYGERILKLTTAEVLKLRK